MNIIQFDIGDVVYDSLLGIEHSPKLQLEDILTNGEAKVRIISLGVLENSGLTSRKIGEVFTKDYKTFDFSLFQKSTIKPTIKLVLHGTYASGYDHVDDIIKIFKWESLEDAQRILKETLEYNDKERESVRIKYKEAQENVSKFLPMKITIKLEFKDFLNTNLPRQEFNYEILTLEDFIERHTYKFEKLVTNFGEK